ncbi:hypothetical protein [Mycetocola zhadangensis]|uniref:hypothetical protein n=1 Tax=Mycetocola zhadangensis TaxID=1164595 RepID=UPI0011C3AEFB|nr:hypothetical protein [Mycetocola zhadangensis]GGE83379.1 hypothetical protein GCM10011313_02280 [Mycetocola zhadangensis]
MTDAPMTAGRTWGGIASVWALAVVGAVLVSVSSTGDLRFSLLALALAACCLVTFVIQLATTRKVGFIDRVGASIVGALVILGGTGLYLSIVALFGG